MAALLLEAEQVAALPPEVAWAEALLLGAEEGEGLRPEVGEAGGFPSPLRRRSVRAGGRSPRATGR